MKIMRFTRGVLAVLLVAAVAVACGDDDNVVNTNLDGSVDSGDATDIDADVAGPDADLDAEVTPDASPTDCLGLGDSCSDPAQCCSGRCEMDSLGAMVCQPGQGCKGEGETCETAAQCCSMFCEGGTCAVGGLCEPEGGTCDEATDCCTNDCDTQNQICLDTNAPCEALGNTCNSDGNCCSDRCEEVAPADWRCLPTGPCGPAGEVCASDADCCNNICDSGICAFLGACTTVYEPCSGGGECCSGICGDPGTGYPVCLFVGGCTPMKELCTTDLECCSYDATDFADACQPDDGGLSMRCQDPPGCLDDGELCGYAASNNCCSGGSANCIPTPIGVNRCHFSLTECIPTGGECSMSSDCCEGVCAPDPQTGILVCNPTCIEDNMPCTTDSDCCTGNCNLDGLCGPDEDPCVELGGVCVVAEDCCDPTYLCENGICAPYVP